MKRYFPIISRIKFYTKIENNYREIDLPINLDLYENYYYSWR